MTDWQKYHHIYTDGACSGNPGPGGWAAVIVSGGNISEIGGGERHTTNNRMELTGVMQGLISLHGQSGPVIIHTDSTYVMNGASKWIHGWKRNGWKKKDGGEVLNADLWQSLAAQLHPGIDWRLVKGHAGHYFNERCDSIAVAFSTGQMPDLTSCPIASLADADLIARTIAADLETPHASRAAKSAPPKKTANTPIYSKKKYIYVLSGQVYRFDDWDSCKAFTSGKPGYPKAVQSPEDERDYLRRFGL